MKDNEKKKHEIRGSSNHSSKKEDDSESCCSTEGTNNTLIIVTLILIVLQLILSVLILVNQNESGNSNGLGGEVKGNIDMTDLSEKVTRIDNFFAANVQGYGSENGQPSAQGGSPQAQNVGEPDISNSPMIGNVDAPITIVEYSDFECPFCGRFYSQTYLKLKEEYIDTGKAKLVFKDFPLSFHQLAEPAAIAATCVYENLGDAKFFEMHDTIFENQDSLSESNLKKWATELGMSQGDYDSCIVDSSIKDKVNEDFMEGQGFGVSGTPSFVINGQLLVGAQPFSEFQRVIETELEN